MSPLEFRKMLIPIEKKYDICEILTLCYPLKGLWDWKKVLTAPSDILDLFEKIHMSKEPIKIGQGGHIVTEWCVDAEYKNPLYKKLYFFMNDSEELSSESEIELSSETEESEEVKEVKEVETRDTLWYDENPLFNPRLYDDIESGFVKVPAGTTKEELLTIISLVQMANDDEYVVTDGTIIKNYVPGCNKTLGLCGKPKSLRCAKIIAFFKALQKDYTLNLNVDQYVKKVDSRKNIWKWIRIGPGYYRNFEWMLVGNRDLITKTINMCNSIPLQKRGDKYKEFKFDPNLIFDCDDDMCLDIDSGELVKKKNCKWVDSYGWTSKKDDKKLEIRKFIHDKFMKKYPKTIIPGKTKKWAEEFFDSLKKDRYIDFDTWEPVKYSPLTSQSYEFSKLGFAKKIDQKNWTIAELEFYYTVYKSK